MIKEISTASAKLFGNAAKSIRDGPALGGTADYLTS